MTATTMAPRPTIPAPYTPASGPTDHTSDLGSIGPKDAGGGFHERRARRRMQAQAKRLTDCTAADRRARILRLSEIIHLERTCARYARTCGGDTHDLEQAIQRRMWEKWQDSYDRLDPEREATSADEWNLAKWAANVARKTLYEISRDSRHGGMKGVPADAKPVGQLSAILDAIGNDANGPDITLLVIDGDSQDPDRDIIDRIGRTIDPLASPRDAYARALDAVRGIERGFVLIGETTLFDHILHQLEHGRAGNLPATLRSAVIEIYHGEATDLDGLISSLAHTRHNK